MKLPCLSVSQITGLIKELLEESFQDITVEGELSGGSLSSTGHFFFSLKDESSVLKGVMFKNSLASLSFKPRDGMKLRVKGRLSVYEKTGEYRLIAQSFALSGEGDILARLEELKRRLAEEGLFDPEKKKPLPLFPTSLVLITSPTGAALQDMLKKLAQRDYRGIVRILPAAVQGEEAPPQLIKALELANRHHLGEVVIIGRGGGSLEDLLAFSDEGVVREVASSTLPVISAVGHQVDWALTDYAADHRSPTPTAAAEEVSRPWYEIHDQVVQAQRDLREEIQRRLEKIRLLFRSYQVEDLEESFRRVIQPFLLRLDDAKEDLLRETGRQLQDLRHRLALAARDLEAHSPLGVLQRGYSVVLDQDGNTITQASVLSPGQQVSIRHYQGRSVARIEEVHP